MVIFQLARFIHQGFPHGPAAGNWPTNVRPILNKAHSWIALGALM